MTDNHHAEPMLTDRFVAAFRMAARLHARQRRKAKEVPYLAHLMGVASLVLEAGGDEDMAIAALLHDAVEDQGGLPVLEDIRKEFGDRVARIVKQCSDSFDAVKGPWEPRKQQYIAGVRSAPADTRMVSTADKLHNVREILSDFRLHGDAVFNRFTGRKKGTLWYYRSLAEAFAESDPNQELVRELVRTVNELLRLAGEEAIHAAHD